MTLNFRISIKQLRKFIAQVYSHIFYNESKSFKNSFPVIRYRLLNLTASDTYLFIYRKLIIQQNDFFYILPQTTALVFQYDKCEIYDKGQCNIYEKCKFESEIRSDILLFPQSMFTKVHRNETSDTYINYVLDAFLIQDTIFTNQAHIWCLIFQFCFERMRSCNFIQVKIV